MKSSGTPYGNIAHDVYKKCALATGDLIYVSASKYIFPMPMARSKAPFLNRVGLQACAQMRKATCCPTPGIYFELRHGGKTPIAQLKESTIILERAALTRSVELSSVPDTDPARSKPKRQRCYLHGRNRFADIYSIPETHTVTSHVPRWRR